MRLRLGCDGRVPFRPLREADLQRAAALSALAGWNQVEADWRQFLRHGQVQVLDDDDPACLAATAAVLPFGPALAWISMVLVRPDHRRQGIATRLMGWAIAAAGTDRVLALDATAAGRAVYARLGFTDAVTFTRWRLDGLPDAPAGAVRPVEEDDWPAILATDHAVFGAGRMPLLRAFGARLPQAAWASPDGDGFVLGRDGRLAAQLGPLCARSETLALSLIAAARSALGTPVLIDLADACTLIASALAAAGAQPLRRFTRMVRGGRLPGDPAGLLVVGGPEFG